MNKNENVIDVFHQIPRDLENALNSTSEVQATWNNITPLAKNEWICWTISAKKPETRKRRIIRTCSELIEGKRRPCCWAGCSHR